MMGMQRIRSAGTRSQKFGLTRRKATAWTLVLSSLLQVAGCHEMGTKYAPGYSESAFDSIAIGYTKDQVLTLIGEPLRKVGHLFIYRYYEQAVNFTVNTETGDVSVSAVLESHAEDKLNLYEGVKSLEQLTETFGSPDKILRAHSGQSDDPEVSSYIYSEEDGHWWKVRVVFIHKVTGKVVDKWAYNMTD